MEALFVALNLALALFIIAALTGVCWMGYRLGSQTYEADRRGQWVVHRSHAPNRRPADAGRLAGSGRHVA